MGQALLLALRSVLVCTVLVCVFMECFLPDIRDDGRRLSDGAWRGAQLGHDQYQRERHERRVCCCRFHAPTGRSSNTSPSA